MRRDLAALRKEIEAYPSDDDLWRASDGITNTGGTLAVHLCGNLRHYIGAVLGGSGYLRDRPAEFSVRNVPRSNILRAIDETTAMVERALSELGEEDLLRPFPEVVAGVRVTTVDFLIHLTSHLTYHLGQIDYHRRVVTGTNQAVAGVAVTGLYSATPQ
jgi:uncharacterized damage-inducible protein DinB